MAKLEMITRLGLLVVLLTLVTLVVARGSPETTGYDIPKQTQAQSDAFQELNRIAQEASVAATPALLEYLDSATFRQSIANLPDDITVRLCRVFSFFLR